MPEVIPHIYGKALYEDFPQNKVNIWHWNINGLQSVINKGKIQDFMTKTNPDIVCFNETKTDLEKIFKDNFHSHIGQEYQQYWNCCKIRKGYSGTGLLTKVKPLRVDFDLGISKHDNEGRVITAEYNKFVLIGVYVPNAGDGLKRLDYRTQEWDNDFHDYIDRIKVERGKPVILTGDLNVARNEQDVYDTKGKDKVAGYTPNERGNIERFFDRGYIDTYRHLHPEKEEYTFFSYRISGRENDMGWRLDYFIVDKDNINMVVDKRIHKVFDGSDHVPIELEIDLGKIGQKKKENAKKSPNKLINDKEEIQKLKISSTETD
eukprot:403376604